MGEKYSGNSSYLCSSRYYPTILWSPRHWISLARNGIIVAGAIVHHENTKVFIGKNIYILHNIGAKYGDISLDLLS